MEPIWQRSKPVSHFTQVFPEDTKPAQSPTEVRICYDQDYIYVAAICHDTKRGDFVASSLKRDFGGNSDLFEIYIDPYGEGTTGYNFGVTPLGVEREGSISEGTHKDLSWDAPWHSAVRIEKKEKRWVVEMAIPLSSLRFQNWSDKWRINFGRYDYKRNETSSWVPMSRNQKIHNLAFTQPLIWDNYLGVKGTTYNIIPYVTGGVTRDYARQPDAQKILNAGIDAKLAVASSMNLDLTVNPDFSQVEVDRQVTNLSRFELQFPERRQFFIENSDLFGSFGFGSVNPFFTRRIGVGQDPNTQQFRQNPIWAGARLSGKYNNDLRIGLMSVQTAQDKTIGLASQNYTVAAVQHRVLKRSNVAFIMANRQQFGQDNITELPTRTTLARFARVLGVDFNLFTDKDRWKGKLFLHRLFTPTRTNGQWAHGGALAYNTKRLEANWHHEMVGENYQPDLGFVQRQGYTRISPEALYNFFPKNNALINRVGIKAATNIVYDNGERRVFDRETDLALYLKFQSTAYLRFYYAFNSIYLFEPFDPTNTKSKKLPVGQYNYNQYKIKYESNPRNTWSTQAYLKIGQYFNGRITAVSGEVKYRMQPHGFVGLDYGVSFIRLPEPYASRTLLLVGPSFDWAFNQSIFLKTVVQYNTQINNLNTNIRFQWRFRPVSDFYVVYTDNYTERLNIKSRGLIFKLSYWI
ncbi:DUF5916 domain-containing protein [Runella salmonicolor]|uniref:Carbohydrate binding family 9 domain-containing protein n=1 Tax=Runella salmonicolor TaxID=2950278 RepID=A0ABT1FXK0_9BACT|nr:DUF5916 domain-containing protein [Runella salmonicolor]MCP1386500.1 carbohydrate binding family 9 domain-containing protein [Runella salmonicolor]